MKLFIKMYILILTTILAVIHATTYYTDHVSTQIGNDFILEGGDRIYSSDGQTYLMYQASDGNVVLRYSDGTVLWTTSTTSASGGELYMQQNGNLVVYDMFGGVDWSSATDENGINAPYHLVVGDRVCYILNTHMQVIWSQGDGATYPTFAPPTAAPTHNPVAAPTNNPSPAPTNIPTLTPTYNPTAAPTNTPIAAPTYNPTIAPTDSPSPAPTHNPTLAPTNNPTSAPTNNPTLAPTISPSPAPTYNPTNNPTLAPTHAPSLAPTLNPTNNPSLAPTHAPSLAPTLNPTNNPTLAPTHAPSLAPTLNPSVAPSDFTNSPTSAPTQNPTFPTQAPTNAPTLNPTLSPTMSPTLSWPMCLDDVECAYIAKITMEIEFTAADAFGEYLSTLSGMSLLATVVKDPIEAELLEYILVHNMLMRETLGSNTNAEISNVATVTAMIATDERQNMRAVFNKVEHEIISNKVTPIINDAMNEKRPKSSFNIVEIREETLLIKPQNWEVEENENTGDDLEAKDYLFILIEEKWRRYTIAAACGILVICMCCCCVCRRRRKDDDEEVDSDEAKQKAQKEDMWLPPSFKSDRKKKQHVKEYSYEHDSDDSADNAIRLVERYENIRGLEDQVEMQQQHAHNYNIDI